MMEKVLSRSIRLLCVSGVAFGMHAANAQEAQNAPLQRVEVTGSRIRQVDLETAQPVQVMTQEQIQKSGLVTVGDVLNQLASAGTPDFDRGGSLTSNRENGGQYISLRNLGSNRLLVLVDGKRWTQSVDGYTDMSTIPSAMIERIEVLKDGASSIYGSDAISGVVNIILKKRMDGGLLGLYVGANDKKDGKGKDFSLSYGASSDKASLMLGLSHTEQGTVWARSREATRYPKGVRHPTAGLGIGPWGEVLVGDDRDLVLNHTGGEGGNGIGTGADPRNPANYHNWDDLPQDNFNSASQMMFQMPTKLDTLFTKGTIELPYNMQFSTTAMYSQRKSTAQIAGYPLYTESQSNYPVYIDQNSYWNPFGEDLYFFRRTIERPRITDNENRTLHIDATLSGNFEVRGKAWNWDVGYNHSAVRGNVMSNGNLNLLNLKRALGPSFMNSSGVVQCGTPAAPLSLAGCQPFNMIGGPGTNSEDAINYIMSTGQATYGSTINSATANLSGELLQLPAGMLGVAGGLEHREVRGNDIPGQFEQSGYSTDLAGNATRGRYTVREAYLEANIPILKGVRFAELLSVDLATRYSDYSNFGSTTNSKASAMWKPIKDLLVRGTWAQGFRAPSVGDTFGGGSQSFDTYLDPCDSRYGQQSNPDVAARCAAAGAGPTFRQLTQNGSPITDSGGAQGPVPFNSGAGNASLQPERAKTKTIGVVYSPSWLTGLSGSLDWYDIKVDNLISGITATQTAEYCYVKNIAAYCNVIRRDPATGQIIALSHGNANLGALETAGIDLSLAYRFGRTPYGQFTLRTDSTFVTKYKRQDDKESDFTDYLGQYDGSGATAYYRQKSNVSLDWNMGNWSATWTARYFGKIKDKCYDNSLSAPVECTNVNDEANWGRGVNRLGAMVYNDANVSYKTSWKGTFMVGANNIFDKKPRNTILGAASSSAIDANLPIDRFVYVRYNQAF
jgi:iron complex outermembrane receptor protein